MNRERCWVCHRLKTEMAQLNYHHCTEPDRQGYYAGYGFPAPPREGDWCASISIICRACTARLRPEERLKRYLDLLLLWSFTDEDARVRTETDIATRVLSGEDVRERE